MYYNAPAGRAGELSRASILSIGRRPSRRTAARSSIDKIVVSRSSISTTRRRPSVRPPVHRVLRPGPDAAPGGRLFAGRSPHTIRRRFAFRRCAVTVTAVDITSLSSGEILTVYEVCHVIRLLATLCRALAACVA